jgi:hypothetical protein
LRTPDEGSETSLDWADKLFAPGETVSMSGLLRFLLLPFALRCSLVEFQVETTTVLYHTGDLQSSIMKVLVATTCSYEIYVGTIIDVFSGPDSCEDLECVAATTSGCVAPFVAGTVSWPSDPGVSDHLRVATEDYEDQFELVVNDVPPAENTACVASVAATYVDALGSTLDLSDQLERHLW